MLSILFFENVGVPVQYILWTLWHSSILSRWCVNIFWNSLTNGENNTGNGMWWCQISIIFNIYILRKVVIEFFLHPWKWILDRFLGLRFFGPLPSTFPHFFQQVTQHPPSLYLRSWCYSASLLLSGPVQSGSGWRFYSSPVTSRRVYLEGASTQIGRLKYRS